MKKLMLAIVAFMLFGFVATAQPSKVDKPTEWKSNTTVLVSPNQQYKLSYQSDGDLVVYDKSNKPIWSTKTAGKTPNKLVFQADGNLVLHGAITNVFWESNSHDKGGKSLRLSDQGRLSVWDEKKVIWEGALSNTEKVPIVVTIHKGTVKSFNASKRFGFIKDGSTGAEYMFHASGCVNLVSENDLVNFELLEGKKGSIAVDVTLL